MKVFDIDSLISVFRQKKAGDTQFFFAFLGVAAALLLIMFFSPRVQIMMMKKMHLRNDSFLQWALLQPVPSMYNFNNTIRIDPDGLVGQMNHFPLRAITYRPMVRKSLAESGRRFFVTVKSTYRGAELVSQFELTSTPPSLVLHDITSRK